MELEKKGREVSRKVEKASSLDKALHLIMMLADSGADLSAMEISRELGITRTTAYTMLSSLLAYNFIERNPDTKRYSLGYRFFEIGSLYQYQYPFLSIAEKHVMIMATKWQIKINISVLKPPLAAVVLLSKDLSLIPRMRIGFVLPAYGTASGKVLLAFHPREELQRELDGQELKPYTAKTITDKQELLQQLEQIRAQGYATELEELNAQHACIAAPIRERSGRVIAAISFSGSLREITEQADALREDIILLANNISSDLGYSSTARFA